MSTLEGLTHLFADALWAVPVWFWVPIALSIGVILWNVIRGEAGLAAKAASIVAACLAICGCSLFFLFSLGLGLAGGKPATPIEPILYFFLAILILAYFAMLPAVAYWTVWKPARNRGG